jgi:acetylornithine/succinyldiaminopimelate/putrescine aminotransferase/predicted amino acid dehydrogenase
MEKINLAIPPLEEMTSTSEDFRYYARPMTAKLLETMELNKNFIHGEKDYLYYSQDGKNHKVLDLTGGYGANILGHRHPRIMAAIDRWKESGAPNLTQGSMRQSSGLLAKRLSETLTQETGEGPWITTFSNSGTEAVEAALKHSLLYFGHKLTALEQEINKEMNQALLRLKRSQVDLTGAVKELRKDLLVQIDHLSMSEERKSYFLHQLANVHGLDEMIELVRHINTLQLGLRPKFIALEKAYHGKTMGALALTYSESFRNPFYLDQSHNEQTIFISQYTDLAELARIVDTTRQDLVILTLTKNGIGWGKHTFSLIAAAFVEPIQGEAGIIPVAPSFLAVLKKYSLQENFLLVFDEIQAGMYRTGTLASGTHSFITPDIYTFSKSLGGGVAKIAATSILQKKYIEEFGFLHTSTFSDDDFSSKIALEVLDILQGEDSPLNDGLKNADYLAARLDWLKGIYPEVIKDVRGKGLMLAVEFQDLMPSMGFEFKMIADAKMQGYLMASALLNHEGLRMNPSLSNNLTLRIQPSVYFSIIEAEHLIGGLTRMCESFAKKNIQYFLKAMYPHNDVKNLKTPDMKTDFKTGKRPLAVFLCHLIDETHVKNITQALKEIPGSQLLKKLALSKDVAEFQIYHAQTLTDRDGNETDIVMLGIPVTSEELKKTFTSRQKYQVVQKVQAAIDFAKNLGASTVGLGQFTSIVSGNGLYLNPRGMNLTTGNAYTTALTVQSALRSAQEKNLYLEDATVALIGAAGNIMSVAASLMADQVGKLILIHHSPLESSLKFQEAVKRILDDISASNATNKLTRLIKATWKKQNVVDYLALEEISQVMVATSELPRIEEAHIVLCGTSASSGFLNLSNFKQEAVIVDVAVPPSIKPEMLPKVKSERPDITYHLGGVAQIPNGESIDFYLFPLGENESYACMAETFAIGMAQEEGILNIGDLNKEIVLKVQKIAERVGFELGAYKEKCSF